MGRFAPQVAGSCPLKISGEKDKYQGFVSNGSGGDGYMISSVFSCLMPLGRQVFHSEK